MIRRTDKEASDDAATAYLRFDRGSIRGPLPGLFVGLPEEPVQPAPVTLHVIGEDSSPMQGLEKMKSGFADKLG